MKDQILTNKYSKIYNQIIEKRKIQPFNDGYSETHHILPRSLGGTDEDVNLVKLKINFSTFVERFERENINIIEFASNLSLKQKIDLIKNKLLEYGLNSNDKGTA